MNDIVTFIINRFPTHRSKVPEYIREDEDFRGLCEDFQSCLKMLEGPQKGQGEYLALARELEKEIATFLERPAVRRN